MPTTREPTFAAQFADSGKFAASMTADATFAAKFAGGGGGGGAVRVPIMSETVAGIAMVGDNLKIDAEGRLSVDTANEAEQDNTRPITSAAVHTVVGNIEVLLESI